MPAMRTTRSSENSFVDENLPRGYVPFNVKAIGNDIVVTYALHMEGARFETDGPGLGFVIFTAPQAASCGVSNTVIG